VYVVNFLSSRAFAQVSIPASTETNEWIAAEVLRDEFHLSLDAMDFTRDSASPEKTTVELFARFLRFIAQGLQVDPQSGVVPISLLVNAFCHFFSTYLSNKDVHTLTPDYDPDTRQSVITSFSAALAALQSQKVQNVPASPPSALLAVAKTGAASIYSLFGGRGANEVYFNELQLLHNAYKPFVQLYVPRKSSNTRRDTTFFNYGMNVSAWLFGAVPRPPLSYLASVPVSLLLIGLTQLVQYAVSYYVLGRTPEELRNLNSGTTGHSQGIVSAVAIAASTMFDFPSTLARLSSGCCSLAVARNKHSRFCPLNLVSCKTLSMVEKVSLLLCCPSPDCH
jgi:fatty acid synthase subunit alpha, fungi type